MPNSPADPTTAVRAYHERTKHHLDRYAAGPGGMDWATQPEPFRRFADCPETLLPLPDDTGGPSFGDLVNGELPTSAGLSVDALGRVLALSLGISAWKRYGQSRWALRCNPSSGNLHPTEAYVVLPTLDGLTTGVYHYRPDEHGLECRQALRQATAPRLKAALPTGAFLVGFSSIPWREAWKYGERAWRYCLLDLGHALGALRYAAAGLGWSVTALDHWSDHDLGRLLGIHRQSDFEADEAEYPELLCLVRRDGSTTTAELRLSSALLDDIADGDWRGRANRLSPPHADDWPLVYEACHTAEKPETPAKSSSAATNRIFGAAPLSGRGGAA